MEMKNLTNLTFDEAIDILKNKWREFTDEEKYEIANKLVGLQYAAHFVSLMDHNK